MFKSSNLNLIATGASRTRYSFVRNSMVWSALRERLVRLSAAAAIARERKALSRLSESELKDIGITRAQAEREAAREYFDLPSQRLTMYGMLDCGKDNRLDKRFD